MVVHQLDVLVLSELDSLLIGDELALPAVVRRHALGPVERIAPHVGANAVAWNRIRLSFLKFSANFLLRSGDAGIRLHSCLLPRFLAGLGPATDNLAALVVSVDFEAGFSIALHFWRDSIGLLSKRRLVLHGRTMLVLGEPDA
eukprot:CAMPEP_0170486960 /NCGR_PEP_ID=MMETSP0208-20121228/5849_1 /TAXON_ID=197538 /ORGANISM="Strombidium inclinatum, Strain S3" /LENGTH=142 /DNA_ID=CAMNT_0010761055 /DNA_START=990 /DNA_END=1418 /DNA_ORIENTATION=+